jgi:hypothetical protein
LITHRIVSMAGYGPRQCCEEQRGAWWSPR